MVYEGGRIKTPKGFFAKNEVTHLPINVVTSTDTEPFILKPRKVGIQN